MAFLFNKYPLIEYDLNKKKRDLLLMTNLTVRFKVNTIIQSGLMRYFDYVIRDHEKPWILAEQQWGDGRLDWILLITNNILEPHWDWPMDYLTFEKFLKTKYKGATQQADNTGLYDTHHYEQIVNTQNKMNDGSIVYERTLTVDYDTYAGLLPANRKAIDNVTYETLRNEKNRQIKLLDAEHAYSIADQVESLFDYYVGE